MPSQYLLPTEDDCFILAAARERRKKEKASGVKAMTATITYPEATHGLGYRKAKEEENRNKKLRRMGSSN